MSTLMPRDLNDNPIPALRLKDGGAHTVNIGTSSARNTTGFNPETRIISVYATVPVYLAFGDSSVTADTNDHYFPAHTYYDIAIGGDHSAHHTHIAARQVSGSGTLYISEKG